jgi:membrane protein implicated in regulation of membrane protease activity
MPTLLNINDWWSTLPDFDKVYWTIAIAASLFFLLQNVLSVFGGDTDHSMGDADAAVEHDHGIGFQFFTLKNLVGFFTIFGWVGLAGIQAELSTLSIVLVSFISGLLMMVLMASLFYFMSKLTHSGTLKMENAIGIIGEVYLPIAAQRSGIGKVQLKVQGALRELDAMTDDATVLKTGDIVRVQQIINDQILLVTKQNL